MAISDQHPRKMRAAVSKNRNGSKRWLRSPVTRFRQFAALVNSQINDKDKGSRIWSRKSQHLLNGQASAAAQDLIAKSTRKRYGIFFSGHILADRVASKISASLKRGASVVDPACGAGDLLVSCARLLPRQSKIARTLAYWSRRLGGIDIHAPFVGATKSRLRLSAMQATQGLSKGGTKHRQVGFANIVCGDALKLAWTLSEYENVVCNPPYGHVIAPKDIPWAEGRIQQAALFVHKIVENMRVGQNAVLILPDVLRSGSRYRKWRDWIASKSKIASIDIVGAFDKSTDVDVFLLHLVRSRRSTSWPSNQAATGQEGIRLGQRCDVAVGSVVPHRDKKTGPWRPYIECSTVPAGKEIVPTQKRRFKGTCFDGPFIVIRRTSSPSDGVRVVASIVKGALQVAVENHLIVITPMDGKLDTCRQIARKLHDIEVTSWVNSRMRCRHLTVSVVREILVGPA